VWRGDTSCKLYLHVVVISNSFELLGPKIFATGCVEERSPYPIKIYNKFVGTDKNWSRCAVGRDIQAVGRAVLTVVKSWMM
jgi:hypothetical protein